MKPKGMIFNIQRFSIHDGPGIRTTVFLKGCPLRCKWCANPESQSSRAQLLWDGRKCLRCGTCVRTCGNGAAVEDGGVIRVDQALVIGEEPWVRACPGGALEQMGGEKTADEAVDLCLRDLPFYEESGGGVTLSGGEPLAQGQFALSLLKALKEKGLHTAVETTGYVSRENLSAVFPYVNLFLFDVKHWDEARHKDGTGVSIRPIVQNLRWAIATGKEVLPRLPVIPGFNDTLADAEGFAKLLRSVGAARVQLLPFHQFGERKYEMLGRTYAYTDVPALHREDLTGFQQAFLDQGIDAFF